jgi:hypothetical protein
METLMHVFLMQLYKEYALIRLYYFYPERK